MQKALLPKGNGQDALHTGNVVGLCSAGGVGGIYRAPVWLFNWAALGTPLQLCLLMEPQLPRYHASGPCMSLDGHHLPWAVAPPSVHRHMAVHCGQWRVLVYTTALLWAVQISRSFGSLSRCCGQWAVVSPSAACWLLAAACWLLLGGCRLLSAVRWQPAAGCRLLAAACCRRLPPGGRYLLAAVWLLLTVDCGLWAAGCCLVVVLASGYGWCLVAAGCLLLAIGYCLVATTYWLLPGGCTLWSLGSSHWRQRPVASSGQIGGSSHPAADSMQRPAARSQQPLDSSHQAAGRHQPAADSRQAAATGQQPPSNCR